MSTENLSKYEIVYILKSDFADHANLEKKIKSFFPDDQINFKSLGTKTFAYPIKKEKTGQYYQAEIVTSRTKIKHFLGEIKWINPILRFLALNLDKEKKFSLSKKRLNFYSKYGKTREFNPNLSHFKNPKKP